MGYAAIGGLILLLVLAVWFLVDEAKSGATQEALAKGTKEVVDGLKRFNEARRQSAGMSRRDRVWLMLQELRASSGSKVSEDERGDGG
jgi:hypothetical protein